MDAGHLTLVDRWRRAPHVAQWWGDPEVEPAEETLDQPEIRALIVQFDGKPFAFLQDYRVHAWTPHPFEYLPDGARGLDLFIGEPAMLGQGHGSGLLKQYCADLFSAGCPAIGIDPHPDNRPARRAFAKAGFRDASGPVDTRWGRAILMERRNPALS